MQLVGERIVDAQYNKVELVALAWGREIHSGLELNEEPMDGNDVDDQPTPIVKLAQAHEYARLQLGFVVEHPSKFSIANVMNMQSLMNN